MSLMRTSTATRTSSEVPLQRLDGDDEVEGRELVLRGGKLSPRSSPAFDPSERRQRQPIHPIPVSSARVDQKDGPQRVIGGNANVQNSTNAKAGSQTLENPSATNFLTNSAPIYNQNVNSGSGQQNIKVIGDFEVPSSYTPTAAPPEYEIPFESEHNEKRGSGLQKSNVSNGIKNKTAGDDRPNGYSQTLRDPHGRTHLRTMAPVYNQNVNSGSGQQNINVKGRMGFQKKGSQEPSTQGLDRRESRPACLSGQTSPPSYRSRSPDRFAPHSRRSFVASRPYSPNRYRDRREPDYDERRGHVRSRDHRSRSPARIAPRNRNESVVSRPHSPRRYNPTRDREYAERHGSRGDNYGDRYSSRHDDDYDDGYDDDYGSRRDDGHDDRYGRGRSASDEDSYGSYYSPHYNPHYSSDYSPY
ncbi:hypothetical protein CC77DRAFT_1010245 [Alternaria alternata]|uniref:Uncharacterized protein n=1 Tax=Alternaria alternata TaxID=5599 RepID=A0A177DHQ7_ALTAL|nr:hypothetical protein CC77DRAFT_1010245 [Alternaria alternata]OAG19026.1 hypothetical protein CC77DRAFT_1010245 [Alternaria alternata]